MQNEIRREDIRYGNFLLWNGRIYTVVGIYPFTALLREEHNIVNEFEFQCLAGVPITKELLEINFTPSRDHDGWNIECNGLDRIKVVNMLNNKYYSYMVKTPVGGIRVQYIHEIQNIMNVCGIYSKLIINQDIIDSIKAKVLEEQKKKFCEKGKSNYKEFKEQMCQTWKEKY